MKELNPRIRIGEKDKHDFYKQYIRLMNAVVPQENELTPKEVELMAYVMDKPVHHSQFRGMAMRRLMNEFNNSINTIRSYRRNLVEKGWLTRQSMPNTELVKIQRAIQEKDIDSINLTVSFNYDPIRSSERVRRTGESGQEIGAQGDKQFISDTKRGVFKESEKLS